MLKNLVVSQKSSTFVAVNSDTTGMRKDLLLKLLESGEKVSIYSPQFMGEEYSEFEKFLLAFISMIKERRLV